MTSPFTVNRLWLNRVAATSHLAFILQLPRDVVNANTVSAGDERQFRDNLVPSLDTLRRTTRYTQRRRSKMQHGASSRRDRVVRGSNFQDPIQSNPRGRLSTF